MNKIGLLFDLDGTLVNSLVDIQGVVNRVREEFYLSPLSQEMVRKFVGKGLENLVTHCFKDVLSTPEPSELIKIFRRYYVEKPTSGGHLYEGVRETLLHLRSFPFVRMAIVTNKNTEAAEKTLAHYLPEIQFDWIAGPERVSQKKPNPQHILEVLDKILVKPEDTWFVGDDPVDMECALRSKVHFLGAGYGFGGVESKVNLNTFSEILHFIPLKK